MTAAELPQEILRTIVKVYPEGIRETALHKKLQKHSRGEIGEALTELSALRMVMTCAILNPAAPDKAPIDREFKASIMALQREPNSMYHVKAVAVDLHASSQSIMAGIQKGRDISVLTRRRTALQKIAARLGQFYRPATDEIFCKRCGIWQDRETKYSPHMQKVAEPKCNECQKVKRRKSAGGYHRN